MKKLGCFIFISSLTFICVLIFFTIEIICFFFKTFLPKHPFTNQRRLLFILKISFAWLLFYSNLSLTIFCLRKLRFFLFREQSVCYIAKNKKLICINCHSNKLSAKAKREKLIISFYKISRLSFSLSISLSQLHFANCGWLNWIDVELM